ncbi:MAG: CarD family transcriptional regulator [Anaerolineales bacterium]|jgi:CarD family transcriptional regulator
MAKSKNNGGFKIGDWVVHRYHGVGKVSGVEEKKLGGESSEFFRVVGDETIFWIPVENAENDRIRPVVTKRELRKAIKILSKDPEKMQKDYRKRQSRIKKVKTEGTLTSICQIVRDLMGRKREKGLNESETRALRFFRELLLNEWAICVDKPIDDVAEEFRQAFSTAEPA